ncbi:MAG: glycosyltransferase family 9 protein [Gemmatimonadaceae bacterium]
MPTSPASTTGSLVIQTSFLGDVVLTTPLIAALAARGPVDVVTTPAGAALLAGNPDVRRVVAYDKRGVHRGWRGMRAVAHEISSDSPDATAYLAQGSMRSAMLAMAARYRRRVGFDTSSGRLLYTERVPYRAERHHAERLLRLAVSTGELSAESVRPRLYPSEGERTVVAALLERAGVHGDPVIALAPGSVWATKRWPFYADLARRLTTTGRLVVVGSEADRPLAKEIVDATFGAAIDATGRLSLLASAALIGRSSVLVTNDSAPQHLASAVGTPTVTLFGPTVPEFGFGPLAARSVTLGHERLTCRPCDPHGPAKCPLGHWRCMRELEVDRVLTAVLGLFQPSHG